MGKKLTSAGVLDLLQLQTSNGAPKAISAEQTKLQIKNLILRAWRERWSEVKWGIHTRSLQLHATDPSSGSNTSFLAEAILQEALNGPGPNTMVLSYLMHSFHAGVVTRPQLLRSISAYDGFHKPFCVMSLVEVLDSVKGRFLTGGADADGADSLALGLALTAVVHWLLTCMYSALENLSDLNGGVGTPDTEHSRIVTRSASLAVYLMGEPTLRALMQLAALEESPALESMRRMTKEVQKFQAEGQRHLEDIRSVAGVMDSFTPAPGPAVAEVAPQLLSEKEATGTDACTETIVLSAALRVAFDTQTVANEILVVQRLKRTSNAATACAVVHSALVGLVDAIGTPEELRFIGFVFFKLPSLLAALRDGQTIAGSTEGATAEDLVHGLELFIENESLLDVIGAKLHCNALELLLTTLQKAELLSEPQKTALLNRGTGSGALSSQGASSTGGGGTNNINTLLKAEATLLSILKTLDGHGDYGKNQDSILSVLSDMLGASFQLILTAASATGRLPLLIAKLLRLNQCSRQVQGEAGKASTTRALIFDISFLMLCTIVQAEGVDALRLRGASTTGDGETESFFEGWAQECLPLAAKIPDAATILARCDQGKVDLLLGQYGGSVGGGAGADAPAAAAAPQELKTSLIFWHELCTNVVGVVHDLIQAWEAEALTGVTEADVKRVLDVLRSRICCLPICIAAWLTSSAHIWPHGRAAKAEVLLQHLLAPPPPGKSVEEAGSEKFIERHAMMVVIIRKMSPSPPQAEREEDNEVVPNSDLFKRAWKSLGAKGAADLQTISGLRQLLDVNGPVQFVSTCVHEMIQLHHALDLGQWRERIFGILHLDLLACTEALLSCVLPACLTLATRDHNFVEPQIQALVTLTVNCILACVHKLNPNLTKGKGTAAHEDDAPKAKRPKLTSTASEPPQRPNQAKLAGFNKTVATLYADFCKALGPRGGGVGSGPHVAFIITFFELLLNKLDSGAAPNLMAAKNLRNLPTQLVEHLTSLRSALRPAHVLLIVDLTSRAGREKCAALVRICTSK